MKAKKKKNFDHTCDNGLLFRIINKNGCNFKRKKLTLILDQ